MNRMPKFALIALSLAIAHTGFAANANLQNYLFLACGSASGLLAQRCGLTDNGAGDVSGDSESSLNPNQGLSVNDAALDSIRGQSTLYNSNDGASIGLLEMEIGPFGGFLNLKAGRLESDRRVDIEREREYAADSFGFDIGVDYQMQRESYIGVVLGYETYSLNFVADRSGENFNPEGNAGGIDTESISGMLFAHLEIGSGVFAIANAGYARQSMDIERMAIFQENNRQLSQLAVRTIADTDGTAQWLTLGVGYRLALGGWQISPGASWNLAQNNIDGYTETDLNASGLNMRISDSERDSSIGEVGVKVSREINTAGVVFNPQFRLSYERELGRDPDNLTAKYVLDESDNRMVLRNDNIDESQIVSAASLSLVAPNGWLSFFDAAMIWENDFYSGWRLTAGIRKKI
ncbi:MAG: autotransporter outer membrane beta-barrel domain-containing protein [Cellvibrionaceae bacterium]|nr:autotransporter outer membrane beta-barrel domain-containing protein [Cellvibrionaceae bacterium]